jgi:predicted anti-sigma-YlaC factor YlaD
MNCLEFHNLVQRRLDGDEVLPATAVSRHLAECPQCRALHSAVCRLEKALAVLQPSQPPRNLSKQIVEKVLAQHGRETNRRRMRRWATVAAAASILVSIFLGYSGIFFKTQSVVELSIARNSGGKASASLEKNVEEAGSALVGLFSRTTTEAFQQGRDLLPDSVSLSALPDVVVLQSSLNPPVETFRVAGQGVSTGLEPIATSARRAINLFLQDIRGM